jgi:hypothetical protein
VSRTDQACIYDFAKYLCQEPPSTLEQFLGMLSTSTLRFTRNEPDVASSVPTVSCQSESIVVAIWHKQVVHKALNSSSQASR